MSGTARQPWLRYAVWLLIPVLIAYNCRHWLISKEVRQILPHHIRPVHYNVVLAPNLETFDFEGTVKIDLEIIETTRTVVYNARDIQIHSVTVYSKDTLEQNATDIKYNAQRDEVTVRFARALQAQSRAVLKIAFRGILNDQMAGFYRSSYKDMNGTSRYLATTQFEATSARRAFPCWDEPSIKATFDVTLVVPDYLVALSNMDIISETPDKDGLKTVQFETTPLMSTYLVAFVVGPFEYIEAYSSGEHNGHPVRARVYTLPGLSEQGRHALHVCTAALEYFADVFGQPYPLPKVDMVAIPDFEAGAMENWGLITYRTVLLLFDDTSSSIKAKKDTAYVVCHELAHQWFGNLVTMTWWEHLWLNEGFATWVGWLAVDTLFPDWEIWTAFVSEEMPNALQLDSLRSSHPIQVAVSNPSDIHQIFDNISYSKSASVIRMLSAWLGSDTFLAGVRRYLEHNKYGNAATEDLWTSLSSESGLDVAQFMAPWTTRVGYPVLNVTRINSAEATLQINQSRYLSTGDLRKAEDTSVWEIPLNVLLPGKTETYTLATKSQTLDFGANTLFKLNAGQTGLYRVNYPLDMIHALGREIGKGSDGLLAEATDRIGLISDTSNLCISGYQSTVALLELAKAFENEKNYFVWSQLKTDLAAVYATWFEIEPARDGINALRRQLFAPLVKRLGWDPLKRGDDLTSMLRTLAIKNAGEAGNMATITEACARFWHFTKGDIKALDPDIRGAVYSIVLLGAKDEEEEERVWQAIYQIYSDEHLPTDQRLDALRALGSTKNTSLTRKYLDMSLDSDRVRSQDSIVVFLAVSANPWSREVLWAFFKEHYDVLHSTFAQSLSIYGTLVRSVIKGAVSQVLIQDMDAFFSTKDTREYGRTLAQAMETARMNARWLQRDQAVVTQWFQDNQ